MKFTDVPIPDRMRHLPLDPRGYPVPVIVMRDSVGNPLFAANAEEDRQRMFRDDRCHICGKRLDRGRWFVGGHLSACAVHGQFMDGGLHGECARYALKVCPYMAAPTYGRLVGPHQLKNHRSEAVILHDDTATNTRPEFFVALMAVAQQPSYATVHGFGHRRFVRLVRPRPGSVRRVELWRHGELITDPVALDTWRARIEASIEAIGDEMRPDVARAFRIHERTP